MKVIYEKSIKYQAINIVNHSPSGVILRKDLEHLGSYRQISRILKKMIEEKMLVKIGFGIYAKAYESEYIEFPLIQNGFEVVAREALNRLGVQWNVSNAEAAYNEGVTQQIPVNNMVKLKTRCRRKISYENRQLEFEGNVNAK